jgi:hypothetical protein
MMVEKTRFIDIKPKVYEYKIQKGGIFLMELPQ